MHEPVWYLIAALAVYRLAYLTAVDTGPARIFLRWRTWVMNRYGGGSWQFEGVTCVFCQSVWYSLPVALVFEFGLHLWVVRVALLMLGLSGAAVITHWLVVVMMNKIDG